MNRQETNKMGMHVRRNVKHDIYGAWFDTIGWISVLEWFASFGLIVLAIKFSLVWSIVAVVSNFLGTSGMLVVYGEMLFNDGVEAAAHEAETVARNIDEYSEN